MKIYPSLFLQVKKAAMVYVAILFFSGEKKQKKTQISLPQTRMPLGCPIQDGCNNDCQEDDRGVKRGLKSLCEAKLSSK